MNIKASSKDQFDEKTAALIHYNKNWPKNGLFGEEMITIPMADRYVISDVLMLPLLPLQSDVRAGFFGKLRQ